MAMKYGDKEVNGYLQRLAEANPYLAASSDPYNHE